VKFTGGLTTLDQLDVDAALRAAHDQGIRTYLLQGVVDHDTFFDTIRANFPLDPPLVSNRSWDALKDSLSGGLINPPDRRVLILWPNTTAMPSYDREIALRILHQVAVERANPAYANGVSTEVTILIDE